MDGVEHASRRKTAKVAVAPTRGDVRALLRRALRGKERRVALVMRQAERKQADALAASADPRDACADLAERRTVLMSRIPGVALDIYAKALRLGRQPAAIGTHGAVCWGCFHRLPIAATAEFQSEARLVPCPHCERLMYDPEWTEQP